MYVKINQTENANTSITVKSENLEEMRLALKSQIRKGTEISNFTSKCDSFPILPFSI